MHGNVLHRFRKRAGQLGGYGCGGPSPAIAMPISNGAKRSGESAHAWGTMPVRVSGVAVPRVCAPDLVDKKALPFKGLSMCRARSLAVSCFTKE